MSDVLVLKGAVATSLSPDDMLFKEEAYVVCEDGYCRGVFDELPEAYAEAPLADYTGHIIMPGMVDLCSNAINYNNRGLWMDRRPSEKAVHLSAEETAYSDLLFAERAQDLFIEEMYQGVTTRAALKGSDNPEVNLILMALMDDSGLVSLVGNRAEGREALDAASVIDRNKDFIKASEAYINTYPTVAPTSAAACSETLMDGLSELADEYELMMQIQYDETLLAVLPEFEADDAEDEEDFINVIASVNGPCCPEEKDLEGLKKRGIALAICPSASLNGETPIPPVKKYLEAGIFCGLGSDMGHSCSASLFKAMAEVIQISRLKARLDKDESGALSLEEAFYMATVGGCAAIGMGGAFRDGMEFDAVVLSDENLETLREMTVRERVERLIYCSDDRNVVGKFVRGNQIY